VPAKPGKLEHVARNTCQAGGLDQGEDLDGGYRIDRRHHPKRVKHAVRPCNRFANLGWCLPKVLSA
jgi:hypothetical protein